MHRMDGTHQYVHSVDGTPIATLTGGSGPPVLLVHGGLSGIPRWNPLWDQLVPQFRVTVFDRRGRGASGDAHEYDVQREHDDVHAVTTQIARDTESPVDVFGHSFGAVCALGAAAQGAPIRRLALYEPPGPPTVPVEWRQRIRSFIQSGNLGAAAMSFLVDVVGLTANQVLALKDTPGSEAALPIAARTLVREADAIADLDFAALAPHVHQPVLLLLGTCSPTWAAQVTRTLSSLLRSAQLVTVPGHGHEGVDTAAILVARYLRKFLAQS